jgi:SAM-dependent methyltransferase
VNRRDKILNGLEIPKLSGVEIGPLAWPLVLKSEGEVTYVDFTDAESLRDKHRERGLVPLQQIVDVDAIWGASTLQQAIGAGKKVDYVIASHVIEHVPDLPSWLGELSEVLNETGEIRLAVPDKRFTFDYLRRETDLVDILASYSIRARVPLPQHVFDFALNYREVDRVAAWNGPLDPETLPRRYSLEDANRMVEECKRGEYVDIHCWVFTPRSFAELFVELAQADLIHVECTQFFDTARDEYEFFIGLRPCQDRERVIQSWERVRDEARPGRVGDDANAQLDEMRQVLRGKEIELADARAENRSLGERMSALYGSTSWAVTRPLRVLSRSLRGK